MGKRILYVFDLPYDTRARELAREFERYGPIVRCDVPPPRRDSRTAYAFVEYEDSRDADDAYRRLHGKPFGRGIISIEWAKRGPETRDRRRVERNDPPRRSRSRSPRRDAAEDDLIDRKGDCPADDHEDRRRDGRSRSASPVRSPSPARSSSPRSKMSALEDDDI